MGPTLSSRRRTGLLYAGVAVFVAFAAFTARTIWIAWQERSGQAKAEAVFDLVEQRMPSRPTEAPGAMAWLRLELENFQRHIADHDRARIYGRLAAAGDHVPDELAEVLRVLRQFATSPSAVSQATLVAVADPDGGASLRRQRLVEVAGRTLVVTRRRALDTSDLTDTPSNQFVAAFAPVLTGAARGIDQELSARPLPAVPGDRPPRPVRLYAVSEDGTLISAPWDEGGSSSRAADSELALLGARPGLPAFAPEEFFFRFDPRETQAQAAYSGFYLDVGGRGLVSTVTLPVPTRDGRHAVLALDLAFDIDWRVFAAAVDPPVSGTAVMVAHAGDASWTLLDAALDATAPPALRSAVHTLAAREPLHPPGAQDQQSPLRHAIIDATGAVAAFQVSDSTWLLMWFPKTAPAFPVGAVALLGGWLVLLFTGFEVNRRRADAERQKAERALTEKQNLLNTMQVPLVVVDPNTDVIVSSNRAAETIGIRAGSRFADLVWPDERARAHYQRMQVASPEPRRAYGLPVGVLDERGQRVERYAVVRSVAVAAPIEALAADERHRLGVLFLLERDADLALLEADITDAAHRDERRRLAGLLSHGVETLARVLEHTLSRPDRPAGMQEFTAWLSEYLERRLTVTAWLLDHWDAAPPLPRDSVVDVDQLRATLARFTAVFEHVRDDRELRSRLHWDNGTLATDAAGGVLDVEVDWPPTFELTCPVRGGFGLFFGEVLANAVRHGRPGTVPRVVVTCDRVRRELVFAVENAVDPVGRAESSGGGGYGGMEILTALARLFEWTGLVFAHSSGRFVATWRVPVGERGAVGQAD